MLTWIAVKGAFKKLWSFLRHYGWIVIVASVLLMIVIASAGGKLAAKETIASLWRIIGKERTLHEELVEETNKIQTEEVEAIATAARNAVEAVKQAEESFRLREDELNVTKRKQIEKIVKKYRHDPDRAARELADQFGFMFVPAE